MQLTTRCTSTRSRSYYTAFQPLLPPSLINCSCPQWEGKGEQRVGQQRRGQHVLGSGWSPAIQPLLPRKECISLNQARGSALNVLLLPVNKHSLLTISCFPITARYQLSCRTRAMQRWEVKNCSPLLYSWKCGVKIRLLVWLCLSVQTCDEKEGGWGVDGLYMTLPHSR